MAIVVKDASLAAAKYARNAGAAGNDYKIGVEGAGERWQAGAVGAKDNWRDGVNGAIARDAYGTGIARSGSAKYTKNASTVGPQRYQQGVQNAQGEWQQKTQPYLDTMKNTTLPPRAPRGSPSNYMRSQVLGQALRNRKTGTAA
jgi:hypothetical protein